ncbi:bifunctional DNA-formamidopyrimidine glycosylase/DNA-(apurinic or apyrimidinic site) lyase [Marinomonas transparens]|uniref:Formamidopyrimidine-DNA glycosylase n=1 Tax=Marinomonas transparens TaxID=2795388 RepID=A0A934JVC5_9GAMM|nr:bifunctional DNA-formamidopyrimidine glycosylase/DNA-(apurinic or apyrimidinic site) lyase [Marinomonas transparens]MBJ7537934.1 bifunctional DNA-formamidopyrimidine glycosylase/DNA-(apurinic or apyrimidinic site) lyase [Marinomonas transparens]
MPELPEVETTLRGIESHLVGRTLAQVDIRQPQLRWLITPELTADVVGQEVTHLSRRGKYIGIHTAKGTLIIHLGMSGSLYFVPVDTPPLFHDHVDFCFEGDGPWLRYTDPRRFGAILWTTDDWHQHDLIKHLGPEPLSDLFNVEQLYARAKGRKVPIKTFIMDSKVVVGVGNIYANEALFKAGIRPTRMAGNISKARMRRLVECIKAVLAAAIKQGGTTLKDFVGGDGKPGYFKQELTVYGRADKPCTVCGSTLKEIRQAQRSTVYCVNCQT